MEMQTLDKNWVVAEVLDRWPETIPVFLKYKMNCVGCSMSPFETLAEAAQIYHLPLDVLIQDLRNAIPEQPQPTREANQGISPTV